ncbi:MAG: EAL domain-containing protein [Gammaproteobacteria bacterium]|nr:EAL domain-containing protein [Gammaproteobacteria bacterium]
MGLKTRLYVFLSALLLVIIVTSFSLLVWLARGYVAQDTEKRISEVADLITQDIVIANITDDYARLDQRFQRYVKQSFIKRIYWSTDGQKPLEAQANVPLAVPDWFKALFSHAELTVSQQVDWFGKNYGELRIEGDSNATINNLWYLMLYWLLLLVVVVAILVFVIETMTRPIINQIESLSDDAKRIGSGSLADPIRIGGSAEVLQLSLSMEQMRAALQDNRVRQQEQQQALHQMGDENERRLIWLKNLLNTLPLAVLLEDANAKVVFSNQLYCDFFKIALTPKQLVGHRGETLMMDTRLLFADPTEFMRQVQSAATLSQASHRQLFAMQDGRWLLQDVIPMHDERSGVFVGRLWLYQDVTENHQLEQRLRWQANHDALTGLLSRTAFEQKLVELPKNSLQAYALLYIDLDQFKLINDTSGHTAGDELLKQVANRLASLLPKEMVLARMGGDEFAVLMIGDAQQAMTIAESIRAMLAEFRFIYLERHYQIGASIGVVPDIGSEQDAKMLMAMADAACYAAKNAGRNHVWLYQTTDAYLRGQQEEMRIVSELHIALEFDRFELNVQRIMPLQHKDDRLHLEILLRWKDQTGQAISPDLFIPAAERYGLMHLIDRWVIKHTLSFLSEHPSLLDRIAVCGINLSGASFSQPDLVDFVKDLIHRTQFPSHKLCFEITETAAVTQLDQAHQFIFSLKALGCQFALDDFGSGQSSFRYLKQLPVDYLKIDGSFVKSMLVDKTNEALVRGMQEIAQALGMMTIAEFVETGEIAQALTAIDIDYAQGWHFHKAEPIHKLLE